MLLLCTVTLSLCLLLTLNDDDDDDISVDGEPSISMSSPFWPFLEHVSVTLSFEPVTLTT